MNKFSDLRKKLEEQISVQESKLDCLEKYLCESTGTEHQSNAEKLADKISTMGVEYEPKIETATGGSVYLRVNKHTLKSDGTIHKGKAPNPLPFTARFADHGSYWGNTISVDPITKNSVDDAFKLFRHVDNPKIKPEILSYNKSHIDPSSGEQSVRTAHFHEKIWKNGGRDYWREGDNTKIPHEKTTTESFSDLRNKLNEAKVEHPKIEHNGVMVHTHNSENQRIHSTDEGVKNFHDWFGSSKVVDKHGRPKVMYHASTYGDIHHFDPSMGAFGKAGYGSYFSDKVGANLFADYGDKFQNQLSFNGESKKVNITPSYLKISNPHVTDHVDDLKPYLDRNQSFGVARKYQKNAPATKSPIERVGHDGIISCESTAAKTHKTQGLKILGRDDPKAVKFPVHVVFHPNQIKSAIGNNGNFSKESNKLVEVFELPEIDKEQDVGNVRKHAISLLGNNTDSSGTKYHKTDIGDKTKGGHTVSYFYPKKMDDDFPNTARFVVAHKDGTPHISVKMDAEVPKKPIFAIAALAKHPEAKDIKAHEMYAHFINHGAKNTVLTTNAQSFGGHEAWRELAKTKGINVHGFDNRTNRPYNTDKELSADFDHETHANALDKDSQAGGPNHDVLMRVLVAHKLD